MQPLLNGQSVYHGLLGPLINYSLFSQAPPNFLLFLQYDNGDLVSYVGLYKG